MTTVPFETPRTVTDPAACYFYHTMDIPGHGLVRGEWDLRGGFDDYTGRVELAGKRVLDVGTASGFLTFEAEKRGAEVVSFDIGHGRFQHLLPFKDKLYFKDHAAWAEQQTKFFEGWKNAYWFAHARFGSKARVYYGNVYDLPAALGPFDVTIVGSVLEHLSDQVTALASLARVTKTTLVLATPFDETEQPTARFAGTAANPTADYTWWTYSRKVYREVLAMLGFRIERVTRGGYLCHLIDRVLDRPTIVAERSDAPAAELVRYDEERCRPAEPPPPPRSLLDRAAGRVRRLFARR